MEHLESMKRMCDNYQSISFGKLEEYSPIKLDIGTKYVKPEVIIPIYSGEIPTAGCCLRSCGGKS